MDQDSVINCDNITTVESNQVLDFVGYLSDADDQRLLSAILAAFDMRMLPRRAGPPLPRR